MQRIVLAKPDDWHLHLRDGAALVSVVAHTARQFSRAIIMPNLKPPVETVAQARAYRERILMALRDSSQRESGFCPLMTLYLTGETTSEEIQRAAADPSVVAVKLYPAGATTNSEAGVADLRRIYPILEVMQGEGMPLLVHGEATDPATDPFDREAIFLRESLGDIVERFPELKIVVEHITTKEAVDFVASAGPTVAATITAHHLLYNRTALFRGGVRPDYFCLPILKRERHRQALVEAATSGSTKFFLGTDSAPHPTHAKYNTCGCAGIYTAHAAIELYAEVFESVGALDRLEGFASHHGPDFYGLPRNGSKIELIQEAWQVPPSYAFGDGKLTPLRASEEVRWRLANA